MYLSQLTLNPRHPTVLRALADVYAMHRLLWRAFPDDAKHEQNVQGESEEPHPLLYRVEPISREGVVHVLAQSAMEPNWTALHTIPGLLCDVKQRVYHPESELHTEIQQGRWLRYRLRANPVVSRRKDAGTGKTRVSRQGLLTEAEQAQWLVRQGELHGFVLPTWVDRGGNAHPDIRIVSPGIVQGRKGRGEVTGEGLTISLMCVDYEGLLRVTEEQQFKRKLRQGLGPAKGLGFGLLSVTRAAW